MQLFEDSMGVPLPPTDAEDRAGLPPDEGLYRWRWLGPWVVDNHDTFGIDRAGPDGSVVVAVGGPHGSEAVDWLYGDAWSADGNGFYGADEAAERTGGGGGGGSGGGGAAGGGDGVAEASLADGNVGARPFVVVPKYTCSVRCRRWARPRERYRYEPGNVLL